LETKLAIVIPPTEKLEANFANVTARKQSWRQNSPK
jgi:hypothetical protein